MFFYMWFCFIFSSVIHATWYFTMCQPSFIFLFSCWWIVWQFKILSRLTAEALPMRINRKFLAPPSDSILSSRCPGSFTTFIVPKGLFLVSKGFYWVTVWLPLLPWVSWWHCSKCVVQVLCVLIWWHRGTLRRTTGVVSMTQRLNGEPHWRGTVTSGPSNLENAGQDKAINNLNQQPFDPVKLRNCC